MYSSDRTYNSLIAALFVLFVHHNAAGQQYVFARLTGTPMNTAGWNLQGDAQVGNITGTADSELVVCSKSGASGAAFYNEPINLSFCNKWTAAFDFRMYDGTGADGLAFCFLDVPPSGYVTGGGLGIPNGANGLKVCFDTWNNCIPFNPGTVHQDMPKIEIRWGVGYNNNSDPNNVVYGECISGPTRDNADGKLSFIRSSDYNRAKITYDSGRIEVYVNDVLYLSGFQQFNFVGYLGFTASTGGYYDNHSIKNVIIYTEAPPSYAGPSHAFCPYDTIRIGGPPNPAYTYSWFPLSGLDDPTTAAPALHIANDSGISQLHTYTVRTSYTNRPGCYSRDSVTLTVYPNPKVHFVTPEICLTDAIAQFYDSSYTGETASLPFLYRWNFRDPNAQPGNINTTFLQNPTHHFTAASHYLVTLAVTSSKGCIDSASKIFTVNGAVPKAGFSVTDNMSLCSGRPVVITNESSVDFGSITWVQIYWGDTATRYYTDSTPSPGKLYAHHYPNPISSATSAYTIRMISFSGITCSNEQDQLIFVQPSPHSQFSDIPIVCLNDPPLKITEGSELTGVPGSFQYSGKGIGSDGSLDPAMAGPGKDTLQYMYTGSNGCADSAAQIVLIQAPPFIDAGNDTSIVINQPLQLFAKSSDGAGDSFLWSPSMGLNNALIANPIAVLGQGLDTVRYTVKVSDSAGCFSLSSLVIKIFSTLPDLFLPNAFTPGKGTNQIFRPIAVGIASLRFFRVFDRWGQLVFSTSRFGDGWDGTISGKAQNTGSFVWMIEGVCYTGRVINKKGTVILIR